MIDPKISIIHIPGEMIATLSCLKRAITCKLNHQNVISAKMTYQAQFKAFLEQEQRDELQEFVYW